MSNSIRFIVFGLLTLLFVGCGPMYETQFLYNPPDSPQGQVCISQCEMNRINCEQLEDMRKENCEYRAREDYNHCRDYHNEDSCFEESCSADYSRCERMYNACYTACGGNVTTQQVCVAFCDQRGN